MRTRADGKTQALFYALAVVAFRSHLTVMGKRWLM